MCGRYALYGPVSRYWRYLDIDDDGFDFPPRYNIAPTQQLPVIRSRQDGRQEFLLARWGLRPGWVKEVGKLNEPINAKIETAAEKPMFRQAFRRFRCLVPASGFYEWKAVAGRKVPHFVRLRGDAPMAFGGLLERWERPDEVLVSYCILTTEPNELMAEIHNRMPVIISPDHFATWLDPKLTDRAAVLALARPCPADAMEAYAVSSRVNRPTEEGEELVQRVPSA